MDIWPWLTLKKKHDLVWTFWWFNHDEGINRLTPRRWRLTSPPPPAASDTSRAKVSGHPAWHGGNLGAEVKEWQGHGAAAGEGWKKLC